MGLSVIATAVAGQEAISKAKKLIPDLILMDIMLEDDIDGIDVMKQLRQENIGTPVIFITGNSDVYNRERAKETNYTGYLVKPISFELLKTTISKVN